MAFQRRKGNLKRHQSRLLPKSFLICRRGKTTSIFLLVDSSLWVGAKLAAKKKEYVEVIAVSYKHWMNLLFLLLLLWQKKSNSKILLTFFLSLFVRCVWTRKGEKKLNTNFYTAQKSAWLAIIFMWGKKNLVIDYSNRVLPFQSSFPTWNSATPNENGVKRNHCYSRPPL